MADFPGGTCLHKPAISSFGPEALSLQPRLGGSSSAPGSATWIVANRAVYVPFSLRSAYPMSRIWWANGATVAGNVDAGVYTVGGTKLGNIGSTAQAGANIVQSAALALYLPPGSYYMALLLSSTSGTIVRGATSFALNAAVSGIAIQSVGATALPSTATFSTTGTNVPLFGIASASVI